MKIYRLDTPTDRGGNSPYRQICEIDNEWTATDWFIASGRNRQKAINTWTSIRCDWCGPKQLSMSDHPDGAFPGDLLSQKAADVLYDLLSKNGDLFVLKMANESRAYWLYVNWDILDIIDVSLTDYKFPLVRSAVFLPHVNVPAVFHVRQETRPWVTEDFKMAVEKAKLTGFEFTLLGET